MGVKTKVYAKRVAICYKQRYEIIINPWKRNIKSI